MKKKLLFELAIVIAIVLLAICGIYIPYPYNVIVCLLCGIIYGFGIKHFLFK